MTPPSGEIENGNDIQYLASHRRSGNNVIIRMPFIKETREFWPFSAVFAGVSCVFFSKGLLMKAFFKNSMVIVAILCAAAAVTVPTIGCGGGNEAEELDRPEEAAPEGHEDELNEQLDAPIED